MTANNELRTKINELRVYKEAAINAERACGDHEGIVDLLAHQYADKTHFIFELLQNADDTEATNVIFDLYTDHLEFCHDGKRLFDYDDIHSIVAIGKSTKTSNYTKIGKHGIGFKAVFAYTHKPRVYSDNMVFDIVECRIPVLLDKVHSPFDSKKTGFIFPFDTDEILPEHRFRNLVPPEEAYAEISQRLQSLSLRTPLFLKHIKSIEWKINGQTKGCIIKDCEPIKNHNAFRIKLTDNNTSESWLVFFKEIVIDADKNDFDKEGKPPCGTVNVAFLEKDSHIVKAENTELVVFFPTAVKTELGFIIHAPFKTTKARDNIKGLESNNHHNDLANNQIIKAAAQLAADSLEALCELELMNVSSYLTLPIRDSDFPEQSFFRPVYDRVRDALKTQPLLPVQGGGFITGNEAKLARGEGLVELFSSGQLGELFGKEFVTWLDAAITDSGAFADFYNYLNALVNGIQVTPANLAPRLTADFLSKQSISWLIKFVQYAGKRDVLKRVPFIRLQTGEQVSLPEKPDSKPTAWFLPKQTEKLDLSAFPLVHAELTENETVRAFLKKEGIDEIDAVDMVVKSVLPKYQNLNSTFEELDYRADLRRIRTAFVESNDKSKTRFCDELKNVAWLACVHASGNMPDKIVWKKPSEETLFEKNNNHETWFAGLENVEAYFLHFSIKEELGEITSSLAKPLDKLTKNLSSSDNGTICLVTAIPKDEHFKYLKGGSYYQGLNGFKPNVSIHGLEQAFNLWNFNRFIILWNILLSAPRTISGKIRCETNKNRLSTAIPKPMDSEVGKLCYSHQWISDKTGNWHKPSELLLTDLPSDFETSSISAKEVAEKLGMKRPGFEKAADELSKGNPRKKALLELIANASDDELENFEKLQPKIIPPQPAPSSSYKEDLGNLFRPQRGSSWTSTTDKPTYPLNNPERYQDKINQEIDEKVALHQTTPQTIRFTLVRESSSNQKARDFLYEEYQGKCQITGNTFLKASASTDGEAKNYFEACSLLSYSNADYFNDAGNMLCVSADTMAKLKNASFEWLDDFEPIIEHFKNRQPAEIENVKAKIQLAGEECEITWSERHFARLDALWEKA